MRTISGVLTQQFLSKIFGNLITTLAFCTRLQPFRHKSSWFYLIFLAVSQSVFRDIRVKTFTVHFVFFYENLTKILQHGSKLWFFLPRSHIGRDSGFSSKIGIIPTKSGMVGQYAYSCDGRKVKGRSGTSLWPLKSGRPPLFLSLLFRQGKMAAMFSTCRVNEWIWMCICSISLTLPVIFDVFL